MTAPDRSFDGFRRIVVKVGSALLVDDAHGNLREAWLKSLAQDIGRLRQRGTDVLVVSSGAIALGIGKLGLNPGKLKLEESQAAAATGQIALARAWSEALSAVGHTVGQILVTPSDTEQRRRYLNARATINTLLRLGAIPIVNENDTVATSEIRYGDNDRLAARVASMVEADCLVLLSDIDGLYTRPPADDTDAELVQEITEITPQIEAMAGSAASKLSRGGMATKLQAGRIAQHAGATMIISSGLPLHPLSRIENSAQASWFRPAATPRSARQKWIAGSLTQAGRLIIDAGAGRALRAGRSLLPIGITAVDGSFRRGDLVAVCLPDETRIGSGLVAFDSEDARRIIGLNSEEIERLLGYAGRTEMIHADDLVLTNSPDKRNEVCDG